MQQARPIAQLALSECSRVGCVMYSQLRPPMMTSLLRKLVIDVPALTENTITPLRVRQASLLSLVSSRKESQHRSTIRDVCS